MNDFDTKKLDELLTADNLVEAEALIKSIFKGPPKPGAKVDAAIDYALAYVKLSTRINESYLRSLNRLADLMEKTKIAEGRSDDALKLAKAKAGLTM